MSIPVTSEVEVSNADSVCIIPPTPLSPLPSSSPLLKPADEDLVFDEDDDVVLPISNAVAYAVSSTTVFYGLHESANKTLITGYRLRHQHESAREYRNLPHRIGETQPRLSATYDLCCHYFAKVHTQQTALAGADGHVYVADGEDEDEDEDDNGPPPLISDPAGRASSMSAVSSEGLDMPELSEVSNSEVGDDNDHDNDADDEEAADDDDKSFVDAPPQSHSTIDSSVDPTRPTEENSALSLQKGEQPMFRFGQNRTDGEGFERQWAEMNPNPRNNRGDPVEPRWGSIDTMWNTGREMGPGRRHDVLDESPSLWTGINVNGPEIADADSLAAASSQPPVTAGHESYVQAGAAHELHIRGVNGVREVLCHCRNGRHRGYERRRAYAFMDERGNVVVKKAKALLLNVRGSTV
ncbi:hypothetical protein C8R46DRAFT_1050689 [Mycena filopes]|nr:hypothetical protein C8R46DRAFT_1050689 [Mycena filopes]